MPGEPSESHQRAFSKVLSGLLALVFVGVSLVLPPVANVQLAQAEKTLQKPIVALIVALVIALLAAWTTRVPVAIALVMLAVLVIQVTYFFVTTAPGRAASHAAKSWTSIPVASGANGIAENSPDVFGRAKLAWSGNNINLRLSSNTGTTQQGFHLDAGSAASEYYFAARVDKVHGGPDVLRPILFGIRSIRDYYTFRLQDFGKGALQAIVYHIIPNSPVFTSGFHGRRIGWSPPLPYVNNWNVITPTTRSKTTMAIRGRGSSYTFYVNDRKVFSDVIEDAPPHVVAVGVTILANNVAGDAECDFTDVTLRKKP